MSTIIYILIFTFIASVGSLIGGVLILTKKDFAHKFSHFMASFAAGTFLSAAFLDLLPEALHEGEKFNINVPLWILIGIISSFLLERLLHTFHHHDEHHNSKTTSSAVPLIIIGDSIHNFVDGIVIAATFMINIPLGIITTFIVAAHEVPQEIGDFCYLLHKGLSSKKVIIINILSALTAFLGAIITFYMGDIFETHIPILISLSAGFFIYIATSDLIPEIIYEKNKKYAIVKTLLFLFGILVIYLSVNLIAEA